MRLLEVLYVAPVIVTVDLDANSVDRVRVIDEGVRLDTSTSPDRVIDAITDDPIFDADIVREAQQIAEVEEWPQWDIG